MFLAMRAKDYLFPILLSALVVPGAGQFYNKEKTKGLILLSLFVLVILGFMVSLSVSLAQMLPPGGVVAPEQLQVMAEELMENQGAFIRTFWYLVLAIWGYSIIDAYLGARDLAKAGRKPPSVEEPPSI
jgi:hypothetical protein